MNTIGIVTDFFLLKKKIKKGILYTHFPLRNNETYYEFITNVLILLDLKTINSSFIGVGEPNKGDLVFTLEKPSKPNKTSKIKTVKDFTLLPEKEQDARIGKMLGYPPCCIREYVKIKKPKGAKRNSYVQAKRYLSLCKKLGVKDPFNIKIDSKGNVSGDTLSHIPCSPLCKKSKKLAEERYKCIEKNKREIVRIYDKAVEKTLCWGYLNE